MEVEKKTWYPVQITCFNHSKTQIVLALGSNFLPIQILPYGHKVCVDEKSDVFSQSHSQLIMSLTFSHDDKLLLTGSVRFYSFSLKSYVFFIN